ncbi:hypothetical protein [Streptomyces sp. NPDC017890]|uniref:hypothetical protein n=1 Tax=Streptomyces sp. NPDC017890 TaxID=3365015 RepID=UPI00379687C8
MCHDRLTTIADNDRIRMHLAKQLPPVALLTKSAAIGLTAVISVGLAWWLTEGQIAVAVYLGMTFTTVAAGRLPLPAQVCVGLSAGIAAAVGALVAGNTPCCSPRWSPRARCNGFSTSAAWG